MAGDPARTEKRTKEELLKIMQAACREVPCLSIEQGIVSCPFCPWLKKYFLGG